MFVIVGLGNPGEEYEKTKHNIGFRVLDVLTEQWNFPPFKEEKKFKALISSSELNMDKLILVKPLTYMNLSGESVSKICQYYKIPIGNLILVCDDLDIPLGKIRIKKSGGPGTHNGMKSIVNSLGNDFPRVRIGIETRTSEQSSQIDTSSYVLSGFPASERQKVDNAIKNGAEAVEFMIKHGVEATMNRFNA